ncbi:MAG: hypothetical protein RBS34_15400 [Desulfofustis sp.]|nr:hypothetical protein [Desulfofustis sp.]
MVRRSLSHPNPEVCVFWRGYYFIVVVESYDEEDGYYTPTSGFLVLDDPDEPHLAKLVRAHNDTFFQALCKDLADELSESIAEWRAQEEEAADAEAADYYYKHRLEEGA